VHSRTCLLLCVFLTACGGNSEVGSGERYQGLWVDHVPAEFALEESTWSMVGVQGFQVRADEEGNGVWFEYGLDATGWGPSSWASIWRAPRPVGRGVMTVQEDTARLRGIGDPYRQAAGFGSPEDVAGLAAGEFTVFGSFVYVHTASGEAPSERMTLSFHRERHRGGKPIVGGVTGPGFAVWPGQRERVTCTIGAGRALRFMTVARGMGNTDVTLTFRVLLDGSLLWEGEQVAPTEARGTWHSVDLPPAERAELTFEVRGQPAISAFLAPAIGPAEVGGDEGRAPAATRPDLVLFLADTFRADNLAAYGGDPELTPNVNALAEESVRFLRAWSPCTWTLPAQASMLTGLYPEQHGAVSVTTGMPSSLATIAERLAEFGYRTGAVTDSAFVSATYGFDQGFEWFQEYKTWDLRKSLRRATEFLDADDGRPVFLFVQTYRAHTPYRTGVDESHVALQEFAEEARARCADYGGSGEMPLEEATARLRSIYLSGVGSLDEVFGGWLAELRARQILRTGYLVFTSDHGEEFREHERMGQGGAIAWETKTRIPFLVMGGGLAPRDVQQSVTLVDIPATLAALAGVPPAPGWGGRDVLALEEDRPAYAFVRIGDESSIGIVDGDRKLYGWADTRELVPGRLEAACDLALFPQEDRNLKDDVDWAERLWREQAPVLRDLLKPRSPAHRVHLSEEERARLTAIGY